MGQPRNQAQPEGRFQGPVLQGPEQGNQGEDQQIRLVPLGKGRGQEQAGEDGGSDRRQAKGILHTVGL